MRTIIFLLLLVLVSVLVVMPSSVQIADRSFTRPNLPNRDLEFKLGLDLQGGSHLVYQADMTKISAAERDQALVSTKENIDRRINLLGVSEPIIQTSNVGNDYRLIIELPGVKNISDALTTIGQTAQLEFREALVASPSATTPATTSAQFIFAPTNLTGSDLKTATVQFGDGTKATGQPSVNIEFNPEGATKFAEITKRNIGQPLAIFLDDELVTAPTVNDQIIGGKAVISGNFTLEDAKRLTIQLNAGALPVPIKIVEQRTIGATLGSQSINKSIFAGCIGLVLIWFFMLANYGRLGLIANIALTIYTLISLSIFKLIPVTLTLAGIAGFILSVGMAVDANILIFERIKEETRWGRPKTAAVELGFHRAWTSVRDSNVSSLITASILFWFGSGSVRGFALTLIIGILISLFSSITITRSLLRVTTK